MVFIHGGGWVNGDLDRTNRLCSDLALRLNLNILSVQYSLSPEAETGTALEECYAVWQSVSGSRPLLGGDSSGGNLAAGLVHRLLQDPNARLPAALVLLYPVIDLVKTDYWSYTRFEKGWGLELLRMREYIKAYVPDESKRKMPIYSPIFGDLGKFPPTIVVAAQCDLLRDEARAFAKRLDESGATVWYRCIKGTVHAFLSKPPLVVVQDEAYAQLNAFLKLVQP
jgi:acetyl esterase